MEKSKIESLEYILKLLKDFRSMNKVQQLNVINYFESELNKLKSKKED